jgi:hypothetical protein
MNSKVSARSILLSNNIVPQYTNVVIAAPISTTQRRLPLYRDLPGGLMTAGTVLLDQLVTLDYKARSFQFIETVPQVFFLNCHYTNWGEMAVAAPYRAHSSVSPCPREKFRGENFLYALAPP